MFDISVCFAPLLTKLQSKTDFFSLISGANWDPPKTSRGSKERRQIRMWATFHLLRPKQLFFFFSLALRLSLFEAAPVIKVCARERERWKPTCDSTRQKKFAANNRKVPECVSNSAWRRILSAKRTCIFFFSLDAPFPPPPTRREGERGEGGDIMVVVHTWI